MKQNLISEVKLCTDKNGILKLLNTLLYNVGGFIQIKDTDSWDMMINIIEHVNNNYSFNMLHFVDWDTGKSHRYFSKRQMKLRNNQVSKITKLIHEANNNYYLEFIIDYSVSDYWAKVIAQYPNSTWIVDNYCYDYDQDDYFNGGRKPLYSMILINTEGRSSIQSFEPEEIAGCQSLSPTHLRYVYLLKLYSDILCIQEKLENKISKEFYKSIFAHAQDLFNKEYQIWMECKNIEILGNNPTDNFSIFHVHNTDKSVNSWQSFEGQYCPISTCFTPHHKPLSKKEKIGKEVTLQPLW